VIKDYYYIQKTGFGEKITNLMFLLNARIILKPV